MGTLPSARISRICTALLGGVFLITAFAKAVSPRAVSEAIAHLLPIDMHDAAPIVAALIVAEILLGCALLVSVRRRLWLGCAAAGVLVLSVVPIWFLIDGSAPACGCTGALELFHDARTANTAALARNGALLIVAAIGLLATPNRYARVGADAGESSSRLRQGSTSAG